MSQSISVAQKETQRSEKLPILVLGAIGVVYGDIGTSPLYAFRVCFSPSYGLTLNQANVLGILSLLFWALMIVISIKYLMFIMRADNRGEGGILALLALALRNYDEHSRMHWILVSLGIFGAAMFYGDSMITPAISILSAVEGLKIAAPALDHYVIPLTLLILTALFFIQYKGTGRIGMLFGPITCVWFLSLAAMGLSKIAVHPEVLAAMNPYYAAVFFKEHLVTGFLVLGSVFLVVTGGEALYTDMGHFGKKSIRIAWFGLVLPSLVLNYFGQGALVLANPHAIENPFYLMAPAWGTLILVILATAATIIASQAVISGAFSLTSQAIKLGYIPRMKILHTSIEKMGQIYIPFVNWILFIAAVLLVLIFHSSSNLASAYGIAVSTTMVIDTLLALVVAYSIWKWSPQLVGAVASVLLITDFSFVTANTTKIMQGGWFPVLIGISCCILLNTWKRGRSILLRNLAAEGLPLTAFIENLQQHPPQRVPGTAIFMTSNLDNVPHSLLHNLKHNKILHERVVFLTITTRDVPFVQQAERIKVGDLNNGFYRIEAFYGFNDEPNIQDILDICEKHHLPFNMMETSFFVARETVIPSQLPGMASWREHLFAWMSRNAIPVTDYFRIPPNRVVELGTQVEI